MKEEVTAVEPAAGAAEPEVIGKKKEEEGAEAPAAGAPQIILPSFATALPAR